MPMFEKKQFDYGFHLEVTLKLLVSRTFNDWYCTNLNL